jgi:hypothetical protein
MTEQLTNYDSPWKEVIELYFPSFLEFFFTQAYAEIDQPLWCNCDGAS